MSAKKSPRELNADTDTDEVRIQHTLTHIQDALRGLQFGSITLVVQDGLVVQIERTEKRRLHRRKDEAKR